MKKWKDKEKREERRVSTEGFFFLEKRGKKNKVTRGYRRRRGKVSWFQKKMNKRLSLQGRNSFNFDEK